MIALLGGALALVVAYRAGYAHGHARGLHEGRTGAEADARARVWWALREITTGGEALTGEAGATPADPRALSAGAWGVARRFLA